MKKIDLTVKVNRVAKFNNGTVPFMSRNEFINIIRGKGQLLYEVIDALSAYQGGAISDANDTLAFIEELKAQPVGAITNERFALIENSLAAASVEVKATWANMVSHLNMEGRTNYEAE
jgi:hypothetical protein